VFFQAVKNDLNNVWMTKNNPHHPCLPKKGSTLCSEYKSSLSSTGDLKMIHDIHECLETIYPIHKQLKKMMNVFWESDCA